MPLAGRSHALSGEANKYALFPLFSIDRVLLGTRKPKLQTSKALIEGPIMEPLGEPLRPLTTRRGTTPRRDPMQPRLKHA